MIAPPMRPSVAQKRNFRLPLNDLASFSSSSRTFLNPQTEVSDQVAGVAMSIPKKEMKNAMKNAAMRLPAFALTQSAKNEVIQP